MKRYEVAIRIVDKTHIDALVLGLVHQGYDVYIGIDGDVCFSTDEDGVTEIKYKKEV